jgi:multidrug efflux pump subunit AcrA (membrane-fusion protein)
VQVSADRQTDQRTGSSHYTMRAAVDDAGSALSSIPLYPGMPVEVIIVTGQRTLADYLVKPITDSLKRAMRED